MPMPPWNEVSASLAAAIRAALPLQVAKAGGERIAGLGLHIDGYYGSAGLYLLPESAARALGPGVRSEREKVLSAPDPDNIGDWPISTDWDSTDDHAAAFAAHWDPWDRWFRDRLDEFDAEGGDEKFRGLLRTACEAMREVEQSGALDAIPRTEGFKIIIAEHDEPDEMAVERYPLFVSTGKIRVYGEPA